MEYEEAHVQANLEMNNVAKTYLWLKQSMLPQRHQDKMISDYKSMETSLASTTSAPSLSGCLIGRRRLLEVMSSMRTMRTVRMSFPRSWNDSSWTETDMSYEDYYKQYDEEHDD